MIFDELCEILIISFARLYIVSVFFGVPILKLNKAKVSLKKKIIRGSIETIRKYRFRDILISGNTNISVNKGTKGPRTLSMSISTYNLRDGVRLSLLPKNYNLTHILSGLIATGKKNFTLDDAIRFAVDDFSALVVTSFLKKWYKSGVNTRIVELRTKGIFSYKDYKEIQNLLKRLKPDIVKVQDLQMSKGTYDWELEIASTAKAVARRISRKKIGGKTLRVLNVSRKKIQIGLK